MASKDLDQFFAELEGDEAADGKMEAATATAAATSASFQTGKKVKVDEKAPRNYGVDPRIRFQEETSSYVYEDEEGVSYEWDPKQKAWFPMWNETLVEMQQAAYGGAEEQPISSWAGNVSAEVKAFSDYVNQKSSDQKRILESMDEDYELEKAEDGDGEDGDTSNQNPGVSKTGSSQGKRKRADAGKNADSERNDDDDDDLRALEAEAGDDATGFGKGGKNNRKKRKEGGAGGAGHGRGNASSSSAAAAGAGAGAGASGAHGKAPHVSKNTSVYVQGLPLDITVAELAEYFGKCGLIMQDILTGKQKIKIYIDPKTGQPKGDALVSYFKEESVPLACSILDESEIRPKFKISVQQAVFTPKASDNNNTSKNDNKDSNKESGNGSEAQPTAGAADGASRKKSAAEKKLIQKRMKMMQSKLDWVDTGLSKKQERAMHIVVLKHMFTLKEIEEDPGVIFDLKEEVRAECEKLGEVTNVTLYDKTEEGWMTVRFKDIPCAHACVELMNGRFFGGQKILAEIYDPKKHMFVKSKSGPQQDDLESERLDKFASWLEGDQSSSASSYESSSSSAYSADKTEQQPSSSLSSSSSSASTSDSSSSSSAAASDAALSKRSSSATRKATNDSYDDVGDDYFEEDDKDNDDNE